MEIVINLPEKTIAHIRSDYGHGKGFYPLNEEDKKIVNDAIYFGTPLPKDHGRLIDADELLENASQVYDERRHMWTQDFVVNADDIDSAPTILEAGGSESE